MVGWGAAVGCGQLIRPSEGAGGHQERGGVWNVLQVLSQGQRRHGLRGGMCAGRLPSLEGPNPLLVQDE
jgi:hypothetical protein